MISQKATILCVYEILKKYSDENHIISAEKIREKLKVIYDVDMDGEQSIGILMRLEVWE